MKELSLSLSLENLPMIRQTVAVPIILDKNFLFYMLLP